MIQQEETLVAPRVLRLVPIAILLLASSSLMTTKPLLANQGERSAEPENRAMLEFSPPRLRYCGLPVERTRITVSWDATAANVNYIQLFLDGTDGKLFVSSGVVGESQTGDWVTNGMKFVLYSPELDEVLAEKAFRLIPCNTKEYPDELPAEP